MKLSVQNAFVKYKNKKNNTLEDVSLDFSSGEFVAVMGPSGSGKSTLLACMSGILKPHHGWYMEYDIFGIHKKDLYNP